MSVTPGTISAIMHGRDASGSVVQIINLDSLSSGSGAGRRYRVHISDGTQFTTAMLGEATSQLVTDGLLRMHSLMRLQVVGVKSLSGSEVAVVFQASAAGQSGGTIGNPVKWVDTAESRAARQRGGQAAAVPAAAPAPGSGYAGNYNRQPQQQQQPQYRGGSGRAMAARADSHAVVPVGELSPFATHWVIQVRVTKKSDLRSFNRRSGDGGGQLFNVELLDDQGTEIKGTFFNEAATTFYDRLVVGKVYRIQGGKVKMANKRFNTTRNDYEITFDSNTSAEEVADHGVIKQTNFLFTPIKALETKVPDPSRKDVRVAVDVIGVVTEVRDLVNLTSKAGRELTKRDLTIVDPTNHSVTLTLWGDNAQQGDQYLNRILAAKGVRVGDFGGVSLSTTFSSTLVVEPDCPETAQLKQWVASQGGVVSGATSLTTGGGGGGGRGGGAVSSIEKRRTVAEIEEKQLGRRSEKGEYVVVKGVLVSGPRNPDKPPFYVACPQMKENGRQCNKKLEADAQGNYTCREHGSQAPNHRYMMRMRLSDATGSISATAFDETSQAMMGGMTATELSRILDQERQASTAAGGAAAGGASDMPQWEQAVRRPLYKEGFFRLRLRIDNYNDEARLRANLMKFDPVNPVEESRRLVTGIEQYLAGGGAAGAAPPAAQW